MKINDGNSPNTGELNFVRQQLGWRAVDVDRLIGEGHPARARKKKRMGLYFAEFASWRD
jgi:hypothetical protein